MLASTLAVLALAGAVASWIAGAWFYAQTLHTHLAPAAPARPLWLTVAVALPTWPFALAAIRSATVAHRAKVNKALVAFFACLMLAVAATSVATNLARVSR